MKVDKRSANDTRSKLRERVKELSCLYGIARIAARQGVTLEQALIEIAGLLPPAWQEPDLAGARIALDGEEYATPGFRDGSVKLSAPIKPGGEPRGAVEVVYPGAGSGDDPFLDEERSLLDAVAGEVARLVERREAEEVKANLNRQLRHADRLTTIGLLAAGVAHELNEPLNSILGFAQLAGKCPGLPEQAAEDLGKIEAASLHAREVIRNLLLFARRAPTSKQRINLNDTAREGLYFLESRCARQGIEIVRRLDPGLPDVVADPAQVNQVLVNLVVNSVQAMPDGGELVIETRVEEGMAALIVSDTGPGIGPEAMQKLFIPFFSTKDVGQGTGLGLPVVHGIVTSHGGAIKVENRPGGGARIEVRFPAVGFGFEQGEAADPHDAGG